MLSNEAGFLSGFLSQLLLGCLAACLRLESVCVRLWYMAKAGT